MLFSKGLRIDDLDTGLGEFYEDHPLSFGIIDCHDFLREHPEQCQQGGIGQ